MSAAETRIMAEAIMKTHDGQAYFNLGQVGKITGCCPSRLPALLHNSGISIRRVGVKKLISAYDIAELMQMNRIAAIDNTSRSAQEVHP